jgi:hypothetical protein
MKKLYRIRSFAALWVLLAPASARAQMEQDSGLWLLANLQATVAPRWNLNLETDLRVLDNFTQTSELILQPGVFFNINPRWTVTLQYMYNSKPESNNENRIMTDGSFHTRAKDVVLGTRLRFTVRFVNDVGTVLRLRHRISTMWSIADTASYLTASNEIFFNLNDQGEGPVLGFEEDRLFAGVGYHFGKHLRGEIGYMWRPLRRRSAPTASDHIVAVNLFFTTSPKKGPLRPVPRETAIPSL